MLGMRPRTRTQVEHELRVELHQRAAAIQAGRVGASTHVAASGAPRPHSDHPGAGEESHSGRRRLRPAVLADARRGAAAGRGWAELRRELDRSRRYGRTFALVAIPAAEADAVLPAVRSSVRGVDHAWCDRRTIYVLLPEATRVDAAALVERLRATLDCVTQARVAAFPEDALTLGALVVALARQQVRPAPHPGRLAGPLVEAAEPHGTGA